ncbi:MAG: aminotransferase class I/II-fold pyridoxal phosphate-dependent enzyme [Candidatus Omnitrophota bacterium]
MNETISRRVARLQPSGIREFFDLVLGMRDVISLGVGEPDFATPWNIRETGIFSLEKGYTTYTSNKGLYKLRLQVSRFLGLRHNLNYDPEQEILITVGVSQALDLAMRALVNPGENVLVPQPGYVSYAPAVSLCGGRPKYIYLRREHGFKLRPRDLDAAIDAKTRALILNYPANPTGASYTRAELEALKQVIVRRRIICVCDEIYDELTYDREHISLASLQGAAKYTLYLNGFSKSYAMTGWRVGYACGPREIIAAMTKIHQYTMLCAPTISQFAGCEALQAAGRDVAAMRREYRRRREFVVAELNRIGLGCVMPEGAFYAFPEVKGAGYTSLGFAQGLLKKEKVAVVPGTAFGKNGEGYVRIAYAATMDNLKDALARIERFCR